MTPITPYTAAAPIFALALATAPLAAQGSDDMATSGAAAAAPVHTNRLAHENSPYLLPHAHNPVDWRPWGPDAFDEARRRNVPIFLSIGYSTCYWCHVMERESFENEDIAALLNDNFVPIKVDREQRPDVDTIYMHAVQALTGRGGWPLSMFLTPPGARGDDDPGLEPFWGGTYFPPEPRFNIPAFPQVLQAMASAWQTRRDEVLEQASTVVQAIRHELQSETQPARLGPEPPVQAVTALLNLHDPVNGGIGSAPKFPQPAYIEFLIDTLPYAQSPQQSEKVRSAITKTLDAMALGGVYDQVGGGFHRYSVDAMWRVPHFEKMLYDNAQLAALYARAGRAFDDPMYVRIARETCDYVLREMTSPDGVFYSAQDAEVDAREGRNYLWTRDQMAEVLDGDDLDFALAIYGVADGPNFQDPHHPGEPPSSVLYLRARPEALAAERAVSVDALVDRIERIDALLLEARNRRRQPGTDDKVIVGWNGLMIAGLAQTALAYDDIDYLNAAERAARCILDNLRNDAGRLQRTMRSGDLAVDALFEDYAYFIHGLLAAHRARSEIGGDAQWLLAAAADLAREARALFADPGTGAWCDTPEGRADLIVRVRTTDDGAVPAPSTVMIHNLLDLFEQANRPEFRADAGRLIASMSQRIARSPVHPVNATRALIRVMVNHPELFNEFGFGENAPRWQEIGPPARTGEPVEIFSNTGEITIPATGVAEIIVRLAIADGYHVNAHEPGVDGLTGLNIEITGAAGLAAEAEYPAPRLYEGLAVNPASNERLMVYTGDVQIPVRVVRTGALVVGQPRIQITYQVCTDTECLPAKVGTIDVTIKAEN